MDFKKSFTFAKPAPNAEGDVIIPLNKRFLVYFLMLAIPFAIYGTIACLEVFLSANNIFSELREHYSWVVILGILWFLTYKNGIKLFDKKPGITMSKSGLVNNTRIFRKSQYVSWKSITAMRVYKWKRSFFIHIKVDANKDPAFKNTLISMNMLKANRQDVLELISKYS